MNRKLIIDGNAVYEIDENCMLTKEIKDKDEEKNDSNKNAYIEEYKKAMRK